MAIFSFLPLYSVYVCFCGNVAFVVESPSCIKGEWKGHAFYQGKLMLNSCIMNNGLLHFLTRQILAFYYCVNAF